MSDNNKKNDRIFIDLKSKNSRKGGISLLFDALPQTSTPQYVASIRVPEALKAIGKQIGATRDAINAYRGFHPSQKRSMDVSTESAITELVLALLFEDHDEAEVAALVAAKPVKKADLTLRGIVFDEKTIMTTSNAVNVNWRSHHSPTKKTQFYLFARMNKDDVIDLYVLEAKQVETWKLVDKEWNGSPKHEYAQYYTAPLSILPPPTHSLEEAA